MRLTATFLLSETPPAPKLNMPATTPIFALVCVPSSTATATSNVTSRTILLVALSKIASFYMDFVVRIRLPGLTKAPLSAVWSCASTTSSTIESSASVMNCFSSMLLPPFSVTYRTANRCGASALSRFRRLYFCPVRFKYSGIVSPGLLFSTVGFTPPIWPFPT